LAKPLNKITQTFLTKLNPTKPEVPLPQEVPPRVVSSYPIVGGTMMFFSSS